MKLVGTVVMGMVLIILSEVCWSSMPAVVFEDDFDDGNFDGWLVQHPFSPSSPASSPDVVPSPQGYSLRGVGSGYTPDSGLNVFLTHPITITAPGSLCVEMRAKSGPELPNSAQLYLGHATDFYLGMDYGEGNTLAQFTSLVGGHEELHQYHIGCRAYEWHTFSWCRDLSGWWSLSIDGVVEAANFMQDSQLTSFDKVGIHVLRNQSEIEWVRIRAGQASPNTRILDGVPPYERRRGCAPTCAAMIMAYWDQNGYPMLWDEKPPPNNVPSNDSDPVNVTIERIGDLMRTEEELPGDTPNHKIAKGMEKYARQRERSYKAFDADMVLTTDWPFSGTPRLRALTLDYVKTEIDAGRPMLLGMELRGPGGHAVVAYGYQDNAGTQDDWIAVRDTGETGINSDGYRGIEAKMEDGVEWWRWVTDASEDYYIYFGVNLVPGPESPLAWGFGGDMGGTPIPEPLALSLLALGGMSLIRRRRK